METMFKRILEMLTVTGNYRGYYYTVVTCRLVFEDESKLLYVTHSLYPEVAKLCNCKVHSIERNIRTVIYIVWDRSRDRLCEIAGYKLSSPPTVSEFIFILTSYARKQTNQNI